MQTEGETTGEMKELREFHSGPRLKRHVTIPAPPLLLKNENNPISIFDFKLFQLLLLIAGVEGSELFDFSLCPRKC